MNNDQKPCRIQRKRVKGWRMPENTIYVGRPSEFRNPANWRYQGGRAAVVAWFRDIIDQPPGIGFRALTTDNIRRKLKGKNLACWCPLDQPCHADVLLEIANKEETK